MSNYINSISAMKYVYSVLANDNELKSLVDNKIYALRANTKEIKFPFICYTKTGIQPQYTKDYNTYDKIQVSIAACSDKYIQSLDVAEKVRKSMYGLNRFGNEEIAFRSVRMTNVTETWESDVYMQILDFELEVI